MLELCVIETNEKGVTFGEVTRLFSLPVDFTEQPF
jgi:hypothetical protein